MHKIALDLNEVIDETNALLDRELTVRRITLWLVLGHIFNPWGDRVRRFL